MAKRFTSTEIWGEDWYLEMDIEYKLFWYYVLSNCDHAGIFKVNVGSFCRLNGVNVTSKKALELFNVEKDRIRVLTDSKWLIEDFFVYQYGETFNWNNRVHSSIGEIYSKLNIELRSIRGLKEVKDSVKDKDIVKEKDEEIDLEGIIVENKLMCPEMLRIFKERIPAYADDIKRDFKPLMSIAKFIHKVEKLQGNVLDVNQDIWKRWDDISLWISKDIFYSQKSLQTISNHIQEIINKSKNGSAKNNSKSTSPSEGRQQANRDY